MKFYFTNNVNAKGVFQKYSHKTFFNLVKLRNNKYVKIRKHNFIKLFSLLIVLVLFSGITNRVNGQDALFSQFYANPLYLNPALTGAERCTRLVMNYRNQPYPTFGSFSTYSFSVDTYTDRLNGGVGLHILHDSQGGLLDYTQAGILYAYHGRLSREWFVNFGMQATYINHRLNWSNLVFPDQFNPATGNIVNSTAETAPSGLSSHNIDFASGIVFYNDDFYGGFSVHHLTQPGIEFFEGEKLPMRYTLHLGYEFFPGGRSRRTQSGQVSFSPNLIVQSQGDFHRINYGLYANLQPITAGAWLRQSLSYPNSLIFVLGLKQVNYAIAYSYDYSLSGFSGFGGGAHELSVLLNFNCGAQITKYRIINCPTF